jgi:hypothetical protein
MIKKAVLFFGLVVLDIWYMSGFISTAQAVKLMRTVEQDGMPVPFDLQFITADRRRKHGGEIVNVKDAILKGAKKKTVAKMHFEKLDAIQNKKDPSHSVHGTVNVFVPHSNKTMKVHVRLITGINQTRVGY